jgi:pimeloyl-ACP methyl ester carboxylesterase
VRSIYKSKAGQEAVERLYRRALGRWPVPNEQLIVPTGQGHTFVIVSGDVQAPPVVLFHGSGANSSVWIRDVAELSATRRVYAVDMIGEPGFSAPARPALASDAYARWLDDVWDQLGLVRPRIVGVSLGGWLALDYAVRRPERVGSLTLISPAGIGRQNHLFLVRLGVLLAMGEWGRRRALNLVAGGAVPPELADFVLGLFRHFRPRMARVPIRTDAELAGLTIPVRLVLGAGDTLIRSAETRERMERVVSELQVTYLAQHGHILPRSAAASAVP